MGISGDLGTMPLAEVLRWAGANRKTGLLEIEREKLTTRIRFLEGRIVACSSTDPSSLLGHYLISRGKITERTLRYALDQQKQTGASLSDILVDVGVLEKEELDALVRTKAEETIYRIFDWADAVFRFHSDAPVHRHDVEVELSVEETIAEGKRHQEEMRDFRGVFDRSSLVLRRTDRPFAGGEEIGSLGLQLLELCKQERTLAEIVLRAHASEYQVLKVLYGFHRAGYVEIAASPESRPREAHPEAGPADDAGIQPADPYALVRIVSEKLEQGDEQGAIAVLDSCYRTRPHDGLLKQMLVKAEEAYLRRIQGETLHPDRIPVRAAPPEALASERLDPSEAALMGLIDGKTNIQSMLWIVPLHEIRIVRGLQRLHARGLIRLEDPPGDPTEARELAAERSG